MLTLIVSAIGSNDKIRQSQQQSSSDENCHCSISEMQPSFMSHFYAPFIIIMMCTAFRGGLELGDDAVTSGCHYVTENDKGAYKMESARMFARHAL